MRRLIARLDPRYAKVCAYASGTVLLTLAAAMVLYFSSGFFAKLWLLICAVLEPAVYGALAADLLNPLVVRVSHGLKGMGWHAGNARLRRAVGIVACMTGIVVIVGAILVVMVLVITKSLDSLSVDVLQRLMGDAQGEMMRLGDAVQELAAQLGFVAEEGGDLGTRLTSLFVGAKNAISTLVFSVVFCVYILMDGARVGAYGLRILHAVVGERGARRVMVLLEDLDHVFSGYIRGQFIDALVVGVLTAAVLTLVGVPSGLVVGLLTGLGNLIPYVGAPLGIVTTILVCVVDMQLDKMVIGIVCLALVMFVDSNVINPRLLSSAIEVHPLLVVAALIAGGAVGGLAGMLVAVPAAAFLKIQLDRWLDSQPVPATEEGQDDDSGNSPA